MYLEAVFGSVPYPEASCAQYQKISQYSEASAFQCILPVSFLKKYCTSKHAILQRIVHLEACRNSKHIVSRYREVPYLARIMPYPEASRTSNDVVPRSLLSHDASRLRSILSFKFFRKEERYWAKEGGTHQAEGCSSCGVKYCSIVRVICESVPLLFVLFDIMIHNKSRNVHGLLFHLTFLLDEVKSVLGLSPGYSVFIGHWIQISDGDDEKWWTGVCFCMFIFQCCPVCIVIVVLFIFLSSISFLPALYLSYLWLIFPFIFVSCVFRFFFFSLSFSTFRPGKKSANKSTSHCRQEFFGCCHFNLFSWPYYFLE